MKAKTKKQFSQAMLYTMVAIFVAGTFLLYLPLTTTTPQATPPPALNELPAAQNQGGLNLQNPEQLPPEAAQGGAAQQNPATTNGGQAPPAANPLSQ